MSRPVNSLSPQVQAVLFKHKGISRLYDWQEECLAEHYRKFDRNLIYSVPTSGGKTLVAEILMLNELINKKKNAVFIVPYVSIVQEKVSSTSALALELGFWVEEYAGSRGAYPPAQHRKKRSLYVCTIEKGTGLINSLIEQNRLSEVGLVVIDELHLIGQPVRGALLENICIKLKHLGVKIVGMSATIGNLKDLGEFLNADVYTHDFRPGTLNEFIKIEKEIFTVTYLNETPKIDFSGRLPSEENKAINSIDPDGLGALVEQVIPKQSCLVFCQSKKNCENVASLIVESSKLRGTDKLLTDYKLDERLALLNAIHIESGQLCPILKNTIPFGVVYHHSGITASERKLIEDAYSAGTINCICCTSTLAAGVNLPAQRVILRSPFVGADFMTKTTYKQMIGRAGRAGLSERGESYLVCQPNVARRVMSMLSSPMDLCTSQMVGEDLKIFIVSCFFLKLATNQQSLERLLNTSFLNLCSDEMPDVTKQAMKELRDLKVLTKTFSLSNFGRAIAQANISCETGKQLMEELSTAQEKLILVGDLHLLFLVTPQQMAQTLKPPYEVITATYGSLGPKELNVAARLGIPEEVVVRIMIGKLPPKRVPMRLLEKFFLCLIMYDLWRGVDHMVVADKYQIDRGLVYALIVQTASYASAVVRFCEAIDSFWPFIKLLSVFPEKFSCCSSGDLLPLMELPAVKEGRARQLYKAGYKTVLSIASAEPESLRKSVLHLSCKQAITIINVARLLVKTKYETLQEEAEAYLLPISSDLDVTWTG